MTESHLFSIYYIPWALILLAIIILLPLITLINYLDKNNTTNTFKTYEYWRSLLIFPTFIGGVGIGLTILSLVFSYIQKDLYANTRILLPLTLFCFVFALLSKITYNKLSAHTNQ